MPPSCASAMASAASVTVSIGAEISGMFSSMLRVSRRAGVGVGGDEIAAGGDQQHVVERDPIGNDLGVFHGIGIRTGVRDVKFEGVRQKIRMITVTARPKLFTWYNAAMLLRAIAFLSCMTGLAAAAPPATSPSTAPGGRYTQQLRRECDVLLAAAIRRPYGWAWAADLAPPPVCADKRPAGLAACPACRGPLFARHRRRGVRAFLGRRPSRRAAVS